MSACRPLTLLLCLAACKAPAEGTFVGNPSMQARVAEAPTVAVLDGLLEAPEVLLGDCDGVGDVPLGERVLTFDGPLSDEVLEIPTGSHCGVFFVMDFFTVRLEAGGTEPLIIEADDFDLWVPTRFSADPGGSYTLRFGDPAWMEALAAAAVPGVNAVDGSNPALDAAFFGGLTRSGVGDAPDDVEASPSLLPGRPDLEAHPTSPRNTATQVPDCGANVAFDMAVPIPPAAMQAAGLGSEGIGWCESGLQFNDDLSLQSVAQLDYATGSPFEVLYNGWDQASDCLDAPCGQVTDDQGQALDRACSVLALCDGEGGSAVVTGFQW